MSGAAIIGTGKDKRMNLHRRTGAVTQAVPHSALENARTDAPENTLRHAPSSAPKYVPKYRFCRYDAAVIVLVILIAAGVAFQLFFATQNTLTADSHLEAVLTVAGEEIWRTNLTDVTTRQTHKVTLDAGSFTVTAESGKISISSSDCSDQICVHTGSLSSAGQTAVCLPFKAVLKVIAVDSNGSLTQDTSALYDAISK